MMPDGGTCIRLQSSHSMLDHTRAVARRCCCMAKIVDFVTSACPHAAGIVACDLGRHAFGDVVAYLQIARFPTHSAELLLYCCLCENTMPLLQLPFETRVARLNAWLASHPKFVAGPIKVVDDLPAERGVRGMRATGAIPKGAPVLKVPTETMLTTESGMYSKDLGPLLDDPRTQLADLPTVVLTLHLMTEHAKALMTPLDAATSLTTIPVPANAPAGRTHAERIKDAEARRRSSGSDRLCTHDHGHGHGSGAHGHSHGASGPLQGTALELPGHPWGSRFRPYLSLLPEQLHNALYFTVEDFKKLEGTHIHWQAAKFLRDAAKAYCNLYDLFVVSGALNGLQEAFTWAHFRWAMALAMSRQNKVRCLRGHAVAPEACVIWPSTGRFCRALFALSWLFFVLIWRDWIWAAWCDLRSCCRCLDS